MLGTFSLKTWKHDHFEGLSSGKRRVLGGAFSKGLQKKLQFVIYSRIPSCQKDFPFVGTASVGGNKGGSMALLRSSSVHRVRRVEKLLAPVHQVRVHQDLHMAVGKKNWNFSRVTVGRLG